MNRIINTNPMVSAVTITVRTLRVIPKRVIVAKIHTDAKIVGKTAIIPRSRLR